MQYNVFGRRYKFVMFWELAETLWTLEKNWTFIWHVMFYKIPHKNFSISWYYNIYKGITKPLLELGGFADV